jgi:hypothetical protein
MDDFVQIRLFDKSVSESHCIPSRVGRMMNDLGRIRSWSDRTRVLSCSFSIGTEENNDKLRDTFRLVFTTSTEYKSGNLLLHQFSRSDCLFPIDTLKTKRKICWLSEQLLSSEGRMCQIKAVILKRKHKCIGIGNLFSALVGTLLMDVFHHRFVCNNTQIPAPNT